MKEAKSDMSRREFLSWLLMGGSLAVSYGLLAVYGGIFIFPKKEKRVREIFVAVTDEIRPDRPLTWTAPGGQRVIINNIGGRFVALSNICPHLGCKVHWEIVNNRFFCPCHAGAFDENGIAIAGPPKKENKNLKKYDLKLVGNALYLKWEQVETGLGGHSKSTYLVQSKLREQT